MTSQPVLASERFAAAWCRMWNDEPALAHVLAGEGFRMWFGGSAAGDGVRGPAELETFVAEYRRAHGIRFVPRVDFCGSGRAGFTWDAHFPDGSVLGGSDVFALRAGRVVENWSIVGERPHGLPAAPAAGSRLDADGLLALCAGWTSMWNGEVELARRLVGADCRIWFGARPAGGDDLVGPDDLIDYVLRHRAGRPELRFAAHREPILDVERQRAAFTWTATRPVPGAEGPPRVLGGMEVFQVVDGRVGRIWSLIGGRAFQF
jgi:SnoaL-like protein